MKNIWLVRHAQSRTQTGEETGWDPGLSDLGVRQAKCLRGYWAELTFDLIFISPLERARATYELSEVKGHSARFDSRLVECFWSGSYEEILPYETPGSAEADTSDAWHVRSHQRCTSLIETVANAEAENVLLFGHWGIFSVFHHTFLGFPPITESSENDSPASVMGSHATMENACVSLFTIGDDPAERSLLRWNSRHHVEELL